MLRGQSLPDFFATLAAFMLLSVLPVAMFFANRSSAAVLAISAGCLVVSVLAGPERWRDLGALITRFAAGLRQPIGLLLIALVLLAAISIPRTAHAGFNAWRLGESLVPVLLIALMLAMLPIRALPMNFGMLVTGLVVASSLVLVELAVPGLLRGSVGLREESWRLNRTVMTLVFLLPILFMLAKHFLEYAVAALVSALVLTAVLQSDSAASLLAAMVLFGVSVIAMLNWHFSSRLVLAGTLIAILIAPFHGFVLGRLIPEWFHSALRSASTAIRVSIYQAFDAAIATSPVFGAGFNASTRFWDEPGFAAIPAALRSYVSFGHPHNAGVQLWLELGFAGVLLVLAMVFLAFRALDSLPARIRPLALGFWGAVTAVALVSHGAWQAWWLALIGIGIILIATRARHDVRR